MFQKITATLQKKARICILNLRRPKFVNLRGVDLLMDTPAVSPYIRSKVYAGGYESAESVILGNTLESRDRVLELGAGMGFISTFCAKQLGDASRVCAVEALPQMEAVIRENFARNAVAPELVMAAIGIKSGECTFTVTENFWSSSASQDEDNGGKQITVPMVALADLLERFEPTYLVVDIEGLEESLFNVDLGTARKICLEVHPKQIGDEGVKRCLATLFDQGFVIDFVNSKGCVLYLYR